MDKAEEASVDVSRRDDDGVEKSGDPCSAGGGGGADFLANTGSMTLKLESRSSSIFPMRNEVLASPRKVFVKKNLLCQLELFFGGEKTKVRLRIMVKY